MIIVIMIIVNIIVRVKCRDRTEVKPFIHQVNIMIINIVNIMVMMIVNIMIDDHDDVNRSIQRQLYRLVGVWDDDVFPVYSRHAHTGAWSG